MLETATLDATRPTAEQLLPTGAFMSGPDQITFRLLYDGIGGHRRLSDMGIAVDPDKP